MFTAGYSLCEIFVYLRSKGLDVDYIQLCTVTKVYTEMRKTLLSIVALASVLASCSQEAPEANLASAVSSEARQVDSQEVRFAEALSRALSADASLRQLIKSEALKRFDNNTDVLYHQMKGLKTSEGKSVRELIQQYWQGSVEDFQKFEAHSPLLNIHLPDLSLFKLASANAWDAQSEEVGVALVRKNEANVPLFVAGDSVAAIASDEIPAIPTLVINQNKRVKVTGSARALSGETTYSYAFLDPSFDGSKSRQSARGEFIDEAPDVDIVPSDYLDRATRDAWQKIKSVHGKPGLQRAVLYYPDNNQSGSVQTNNVEEHLLRFRINPQAYWHIADQGTYDPDHPGPVDPMVREDMWFDTYKQQKASVEALALICWTRGVFTFEIEVNTLLRNGGAKTQKIVCSVRPQELFIFNPEVKRRHATWFRKTRYTYRLRVNRLQSRWVYPAKLDQPTPTRVSEGWNLEEEALTKLIRIQEFDPEVQRTRSEKTTAEFIATRSTTSKLKIEDVADAYSSTNGTTKRDSREVTYTVSYTDRSDDLGSLILHFNDPVIDEQVGDGFRLYNISAGNVTMTFMPSYKSRY